MSLTYTFQIPVDVWLKLVNRHQGPAWLQSVRAAGIIGRDLGDAFNKQVKPWLDENPGAELFYGERPPLGLDENGKATRLGDWTIIGNFASEAQAVMFRMKFSGLVTEPKLVPFTPEEAA